MLTTLCAIALLTPTGNPPSATHPHADLAGVYALTGVGADGPYGGTLLLTRVGPGTYLAAYSIAVHSGNSVSVQQMTGRATETPGGLVICWLDGSKLTGMSVYTGEPGESAQMNGGWGGYPSGGKAAETIRRLCGPPRVD